MDIHYSFLDNKFQAYLEDENDILIEDGIVKSISFNVGIPGANNVLDDAASIFGKRDFKKIKINTVSR